MTVLLVLIGGALGAPARYVVDLMVQSRHDSVLPWGTFVVNAAGSLVRLYRLDSVRVGARELARIVTASTDQVRLAVGAMQEHKGLMPHAIEVNRLENEADRVHHQAVSKLFEEERDPLTIIKWKETFDFLEDASDRCEDVANVIEGVMVKHG